MRPPRNWFLHSPDTGWSQLVSKIVSCQRKAADCIAHTVSGTLRLPCCRRSSQALAPICQQSTNLPIYQSSNGASEREARPELKHPRAPSARDPAEIAAVHVGIGIVVILPVQ